MLKFVLIETAHSGSYNYYLETAWKAWAQQFEWQPEFRQTDYLLISTFLGCQNDRLYQFSKDKIYDIPHLYTNHWNTTWQHNFW